MEAELNATVAALNSQLVQTRTEQPRISSLSEIYDDLAALGGEFQEVSIDFDAGTISVTTQPITLRGVHFGRFEIRLEWRELADRRSYRVIALEPNPAATNDAVTHPHVQDERLCEGDGREAIEAALAQGRLGDFFLIVTQLLNTYAQGQAYVELSSWQGTPCSDCGAHVDDDERYFCDRCDAELCGGCSSSCEGCGNGFCSNCIKSCQDCQRASCESCLTACTGCQSRCCQECLDDQRCSACQAEQEEESNDEEESDETAHITETLVESPATEDGDAKRIAIQPDGLGEAALRA